jgi:hypothetical protein
MVANMALAGLAGIVTQLLFAYFPGLKNWYDAQSSDVKGLVQWLVLAILAFGGFLPVCFGWFTKQIPLTCDQAGVEQAVLNFIIAVGANQSTYLVHVKARKAAKKV